MMIPKVIHYIWLGGKSKPALVNACILSWYEKMPDYKIVEWNESNLDLNKLASDNRFFAECRKRHLWAFAADYLRLKILYEFGGVYLDTDMQVLKSLDPLLGDTFFLGKESEQDISCGIIASCPKHPFLKETLEFYNNQIWLTSIYTIPMIVTKLVDSGKSAESLKIYPPRYFYPFPYRGEFSKSCITEDTYTIHWWAGSWTNKLLPYLFLNTKHIHNPINKIPIILNRTAAFCYHKINKS